MALNKNYKRAIGIIASYLFGLQSSNCEFKDHSYFEPKWCSECKHVYHKGDTSACSHGKVNAAFNDLYLQSNYVGPDGLLWFIHKTDSDKIFFIILRNKDGSKVNSNLNKEFENYDFTILSKKYLVDTLTNPKASEDIKNRYKEFLNSFNNARDKKGYYIDWANLLQDNPLDNVGAYLGGFVKKIFQIYSLDECKRKNEDKRLMLAHATNLDTTYHVLETRYNRNNLAINNQDTTRGLSDAMDMREGGMLFFAIDDKDLPSQYAKGPSHFLSPLARFPLVLLEPDKGKWLANNFERIKYKKENLYSYVMVSDGKTMLSYVNDFYSKNKNWDSLMEKYQIDQSPEILVPCRIFANNWNNRKWTKERQNSWNSKWD